MNPIPSIKNYKKSFISKRSREKQDFTNWINSTFITILWLISWLFIYYIFTLNTYATDWYEIVKIEEKINNLISHSQTIDAKIFELSSTSNISKNKIIKENMIKEDTHKNLVIKQWKQYVFNN